MVLRGLKKWAEENNWKVRKGIVYREYNGYYFTAYDGNGCKCFVILLPYLDESQRERIVENLMHKTGD